MVSFFGKNSILSEGHSTLHLASACLCIFFFSKVLFSHLLLSFLFFQCLYLLAKFQSAASEFFLDPFCVSFVLLLFHNYPYSSLQLKMLDFLLNLFDFNIILLVVWSYKCSLLPGGLERLRWKLTFPSFTYGWGLWANFCVRFLCLDLWMCVIQLQTFVLCLSLVDCRICLVRPFNWPWYSLFNR